jgi:glucans biosynthesis protein C
MITSQISDPPLTPVTAASRYHALDSLRAVMMLLGVVLHAAISYGSLPYGAAWPYKDASTNPLCDVLVVGIHVFRMPIFFVMAGFFAALLHERRGLGGLLRNRARRILVPFLVGWVVLFPLTVLGFRFALRAGFYSLGPGIAGAIANQVYANPNNTIHLWFLYDLLFFYAAAALAVSLADRLGEGLRRRLLRGFRSVVQNVYWRPMALGAVTMLTLLPMRFGAAENSTSFLPPPRVLLFYGVFFAFGWLFHAQRDLLPSFQRLAWTQIVVAAVLFPVNMLAFSQLMADATQRPLPTLLMVTATGGLTTWLLVFGITGLFVRYLDRERPRMRYLTDASYWLYLVHLPLIICVAGMLGPARLPGLVKMAAVLAFVSPVLLLSYHFMVRSTVIGEWLNGTRHPRSFQAWHRATASAADLWPPEPISPNASRE